MESEPLSFEQTATSVFRRTRDGAGPSDDLIAHYLPRLRAFVRARIGRQLRRRESESDVIQSICRAVIEERGRLDFREETQFRAWLFTAALNKIRAKGRFWGQQRRASENETSLGPDRGIDELTRGYQGVFTPSRIAAAAEQVERLENAIEQLPEEYREVISLARLARLPHEEVAIQMDKSVGAVRQMLGRALRKLSEHLRETEAE